MNISSIINNLDSSCAGQELIGDIKTVCVFPEKVIQKLPEISFNCFQTPSTLKQDKLIEEYATALKINMLELARANRFCKYLFRQFMQTDTSADDIIDVILAELLKQKSISDIEAAKLKSFMHELSSYKNKYALIAKEMEYSNNGLPSMRSISTSIDYRIIFNSEFKSTTNINEYNPICQGVVPVVIVRLTLDEGPNQEIYFQVNLNKFDILLNELKTVSKKIEAAKNYLGLENKKD